jgi:hypothetical protein
MGIGSLTQPILCKKHNDESGQNVDWASKHTRDTLREVMQLWEARKRVLSRSWTLKYFETNMQLLERWCLKTLINLNNQTGWKYLDGSDPNSPPVDLVESVFGRRRFTDYKGLYVIAETGANHEMEDRETFTTKTTKDGLLVGATCSLWGFPFYLNLMPEQIRWEGGNLMRNEQKWWFRTRDRKGRYVKSHLVLFKMS